MQNENEMADYASKFLNADSAFQYWFNKVMAVGQFYAGNTRAVFNASFTMDRPLDNEIRTPWRKWNKEYAEVESNWYKLGDRRPTMVEDRAKIWANMKDDRGYVNSNYGWWW